MILISIKTADLTQDFKRVADRIVNGETVLISRPRNENLVIITEAEYNELESLRRDHARETLKETIKAMQEQSAIDGTDKMTMDEINAEIAACRREKRGEP